MSEGGETESETDRHTDREERQRGETEAHREGGSDFRYHDMDASSNQRNDCDL